MKVYKLTSFVIFIILFSSNIFAATIKGTLYDLELNKLEDVIVQLNSTPLQTQISKNGIYSFDISKGKYTIIAKKEDSEIYAKERFTIKEEGTYVFDLILFPSLEEEEFLLNETNEDYEEENSIKNNYLLFILFFIIILYFIIKKIEQKNKQNISHNSPTTNNQQPTTPQIDDLAKQILDFVSKEQGRVTQKEIREQFPLSEAKISLIITELEEKGFVKKIKKGRGNIIVKN